MSVTNDEIYDKLLDIEKRLIQIEKKIGVVKRPETLEYSQQQLKPIQFEQPQPKKQTFIPPLSNEVKEINEVKKVEVKKKKSLIDKDEDIVNSIKQALGFV